MILGGVTVSYERGTPVIPPPQCPRPKHVAPGFGGSGLRFLFSGLGFRVSRWGSGLPLAPAARGDPRVCEQGYRVHCQNSRFCFGTALDRQTSRFYFAGSASGNTETPTSISRPRISGKETEAPKPRNRGTEKPKPQISELPLAPAARVDPRVFVRPVARWSS